MPIIRTVGIISKPNAPAAAKLVPDLLDWLRARGHRRAHRRADCRIRFRAASGTGRARRCPKAATW